MSRLIALLTDFGSADPYVAQVKAAMLRDRPNLAIIDLSHEVSPYDLAQGGFFLASSLAHFPAGSIFVVVVDPGVGGARRIVLCECQDRFILAPDNGLLSLLSRRPDAVFQAAWDCSGWIDVLGASATFHGRDVFAPLAAKLAALLDDGRRPDPLGPAIAPTGLVRLHWASPVADGPFLLARVLHVDRFGNCVLNLATTEWLDRLHAASGLEILSPVARGLEIVLTYADISPGSAAILAGSQGFLELAMRQASAAEALDLSPGDDIRLAAVGEAL